MNKLICVMLFLCGCQNELTLKNQIQHELNVDRVFLNSPYSITVMYKSDDGVFEAQTVGSMTSIKFITGGTKKYITWNTYTGDHIKCDVIYDMKVYIPDVNDVESGENRRRSGGKSNSVIIEKLNEL